MMRIPKATAPGFALPLAAGTTVAAQAPGAAAASAAATLIVNANTALRPVAHVASGALHGLSADGTPAARYVDPLHPSGFAQMAQGGSQLPNGETAPAGDALVVAPEPWNMNAAGSGEYKIVDVASGLDLGIGNASTSQGANALIWTDNGTTDHLRRLNRG